MQKYFNIKSILFIAILLRLSAVVFVADLNEKNYWEYGEIAKNIVTGKGFSLFYIEGAKLGWHSKDSALPFPSAYMPPLYVGWLVPFMAVDNILLRNILLLSANIIVSIVVILMLFHYVKKHFEARIALFSALIYATLPEFIFASLSYTPTLLFHLLILYILISLDSFSKWRYLHLFVSIILLVSLRSEMILLGLVFAALLLIKKEYYKVAVVLSSVLIFVSAWTIRNYYAFDEFVPLTTNGGINLYRGFNSEGIGSWGDGKVTDSLYTITSNKHFELEMNRRYMDSALEYINQNKLESFYNSFKKLFHLWMVNPMDKRSFHPLYLIPWIALLLFSIIGLIKTYDIPKYKYIYTALIVQSFVVMLFFAIPRYQTMIKILLIPFASYAVVLLSEILKVKIQSYNSRV